MWSALAELASASPWLVLIALAILAAAFLASFALSVHGTGASDRVAVIRAFAELIRSLRSRRR